MKINKVMISTLVLFLSGLSSQSYALEFSNEDIARVVQVLKNRTGTASRDDREKKYLLGILTGCPGNTFRADVNIENVSITPQNSTLNITVHYKGKYTREIWLETGCVMQSPDLGGRENRNLYGDFSFQLTHQMWSKPTIAWGNLSNIGEMKSPEHDSNLFAKIALMNAINKAFE